MKEHIWAFLIHLGTNMWSDTDECRIGGYLGLDSAPSMRNFLLCDDGVWDRVISHLPAFGVNTLVVDVGDGIEFESHPELRIRGSWSKQKLDRKLSAARELGLTVVPKLNFSACHDAWLKEYSRMVSTSTYYRVTRDLICETAELFSNPPLFHLGMDEENYGNQRSYDYAVIRSGDLWWSDLDRLFDACNSVGARPWVWSDVIWSHPEEFSARMPREVLQSNWYYGTGFEPDESGRYNRDLESFLELDELGFEQVPTGSNWERAHNMEQLAAFCDEHLSRENLAGFMMAPWCFTIPKEYYRLMDGAAHLSAAQKRVMGS